MKLKQYYLECLSHASYLLLDETSSTAVVIDPQRDVEQYVQDAAAADCQIKYVVLTHFQTEFLTGHLEIRNQCGANILIGRRGNVEFEATKLNDGDVIEFGRTRLQILETPGHTPESISVLVFDLDDKATPPRCVFTGDTLLIGEIGRPDLAVSAGSTLSELADQLYDSLTCKLGKLPDMTRVYPAHGAQARCGGCGGTEICSTIGEQRKFNYALQSMSRESFRQLITSDCSEAPDYHAMDARLNRQEHPGLKDSVQDSMETLSLQEVLSLKETGAQLLDTRKSVDFEAAHLAGSFNIGMHGKFDIWCGTFLNASKPIVLITDEGDEEEAITRLGRIGFDNVAGYLVHGMQSLRNHPEYVNKIDRITAVALADRLRRDQPPLVCDVRSEQEWNRGHIDGSINVPLNHLRERIAEIPRDRRVAVYCEGGYRSAIGVSILSNHGYQRVSDLVGGYQAWMASSLPINRCA
jgi:glyoxylase-like metal-dependent hydrolase (beta-lactamase superfamily II)/rhodanese-related sulfurtransferase